MGRLVHTNSAFKRLMQMSQSRVFVFVEGFDTDRYFYGNICEPLFAERGVSYEIVGAWRLAESGGKQVLIDFYNYLFTTNFLSATFQGKHTAVVFFLDKDIDDILNRKILSDHICYTEYYSVENYLFVAGRLADTIAAASALEVRAFHAAIGDAAAWRRRKAEAWRDWVAFCIFVQKYRIHGAVNYGRASLFNIDLDGAVDANILQTRKAELQQDSRMTPEQFERAFRRIYRLVDQVYARGHHDRIFKGRWYVALLQKELERVAGTERYDINGLPARILAAARGTLDFSGLWATFFRSRLRIFLQTI